MIKYWISHGGIMKAYFIESDGGKYTVKHYESIVREAEKSGNYSRLLEHTKKLNEAGYLGMPYYSLIDNEHIIIEWLEFLTQNGSRWAADKWCFYAHFKEKDDDMASWAWECYISALEKKGELVAPEDYYKVGYWCYQIFSDVNPRIQREQFYGKILRTGQWYQKALDAGFNRNEIGEGAWCVDILHRYTQNNQGSSKK